MYYCLESRSVLSLALSLGRGDSRCVCVLQSDESSQHLSAEEKACLTFLEETIESIVTEDDDAQSSGDTISKNHHITHGVHQDR